MVIDASIAVDGLIDQTSAGDHARELMGQPGIYVPDLLYSEVSSALRRHEMRLERSLDSEFGTLLRIPWDWVPISVFSPLTWALRHEVSLYDAAYVALAMALGVPLATKDRKLARASTRYCEVVIPGE